MDSLKGKKFKSLLITSVKDEGPWLIEWVAYHKSIGFDNIIITQNDSTDGTREILSRLDLMGEITYIDNSDCEGKPQLVGLKKATLTQLYAESEWCLVLDADEYLNIRSGACVNDFLDFYIDSVAIAINWLNFGSSNQNNWSPGMVIDRFQLHASLDKRQNYHFKSFHKVSEEFYGIGIHRPWRKEPKGDFVYPNRQSVPFDIQSGTNPITKIDAPADHSVCVINHYSVKSHEEFKRKLSRGDGFFVNKDYQKGKFSQFDTNDVKNEEIIMNYYLSARNFYLKLLSDKVLSELYYSTCYFHFYRNM